MGLCPSRNTAKNAKFVQGKTYQPHTEPAPVSPSKLRADAAAFVPKPTEPVEKQAWELFLEQKTQERGTKKPAPFARRHDGTYTQEYRKLLDPTAARGRNPTLAEVQAATGAVTTDVVKAWQDCAPKPKPPPGLAKPKKTKDREVDVLREAVKKARQLPKDQVLEMLNQQRPSATDDAPCVSNGQRFVPFGLTDRHYWSGDEDQKQSHQHRSTKPTPQREYVTSNVTGDLEETITEVLYKLRLLRGAEEHTPTAGRRYCVGLREVVRACKDPGALKAVLVAPDLEENSKGLDEKLQQLLQTCKKAKIPVVFGLSRLRLGQAIKKNVTVSVLGVLDTRGCQDAFGRMLALA